MQSLFKHKDHYDQKAEAADLRKKTIKQLIADHQVAEILSQELRWIRPYFVQKALSNENYVARKRNTNETLILHEIRLRRDESYTSAQEDRPE